MEVISPLDGRYQNEAVALECYLSEDAFIEYCKKVEVALLNQHCMEQGLDVVNVKDFPFILEDVNFVEQETHHQIKALVNLMRDCLKDRRRELVHLGVTSSDIQDTANILRYRDTVRNLIKKKLEQLERLLIEKMVDYRKVSQMGRTHGQYAVCMSHGWWWAEYVSRIGQCYYRVMQSVPVYGQMSGAVGNYSGLRYIYEDPVKFSRNVLESLGLKQAEYSSQILPFDNMLRFLNEIGVCFGVLANLADDIRNLQRSEISEVREEFTEKQVGSSTMPQKRNPWNCEHVKSLWKEFMPRLVTFNMDLISEHQRDLTNSATSRFVPEYLAGFYLALSRTCDIVFGLQINKDFMEDRVVSDDAEKAYVLLSLAGVSNAHEIVRQMTLLSEKDGNFNNILENSIWWDSIKDKFYKPYSDPSWQIMDQLMEKYGDI